MKLAYADPPYPGRSHLYEEHPDYAGEVDHCALVGRLVEYEGWALSTNSDSLHYVLGLCPHGVQVAAWVRTNAPPFNADGCGVVRSWEPVVYQPARRSRFEPDRVRDVLHAGAPTGTIGKGLTGSKPTAFAEWVFSLVGAEVTDTLEDLFPGTGIIGKTWTQWQSQPRLWAAAIGGPRSNEHLPKQRERLIEDEAA